MCPMKPALETIRHEIGKYFGPHHLPNPRSVYPSFVWWGKGDPIACSSNNADEIAGIFGSQWSCVTKR
ncbi:hypothetical protein BHE74_00041895 [Ensete ventricosum]|nr:hypothetical protein BHE74_00041895 [Ensete ventricosum]